MKEDGPFLHRKEEKKNWGVQRPERKKREFLLNGLGLINIAKSKSILGK